MPEIKNTFTSGKMNKDLDERLVRNNEYRDAVNIQVSNSDGSNVGVVENVLGNNQPSFNYNLANQHGSRCVGTIADESKDVIYWFVASPMSGHVQYELEGDPNSGILKDWSCIDCVFDANRNSFLTGGTQDYIWKDKIMKYSPSTTGVAPVFVDNFMFKTEFKTTVNDQSGINLNDPFSSVFDGTSNKHYYILTINAQNARDLVPGMTAYFFNDISHANALSLTQLPGSLSQDIGVTPVTRTILEIDKNANNEICVVFDKDLTEEHDGANFASGNALVDSSVHGYNYIVFTKKRLLNFNCGNIVTGINILYDFLLWTDNDAEPKKLHVPRSILGTDPNGKRSTRLIVEERGISGADNILVKEENISTIKKYPKNKPLVEEKIEYLLSATSEHNFVNGYLDPNTGINNVTINDPGDVVVVEFDSFAGGNSFVVGEELRFLEQGGTQTLPNNYDVRCKVVENVSNVTINYKSSNGNALSYTYPPNSYKLEILSISSSTTIDTAIGIYANWMTNATVPIVFDVQRVLDNKVLFEKNLARFGYRWKYQDGEYSTFSPFSDIIFEPGKFNYDSKKAYNTAMQNQLIRLTLRNIIASDMPGDVIQVDILYVDANSPSVYVVDKLRYNDYAHVSIGSQMFNHWKSNQYQIKSDIIYAVVPENQSFRSWDNVPRKALAQEITGNRLVYGNYLQNYTLKNNYEGLYEKPVLETSLDDRWSPLIVFNTDPKGNVTFVTSRVLYNDTYFDEQAISNPELDYPFLEAEPLVNLMGNHSLKSDRKYQLGFTYLDEYGRETPVFSNSEATIDVSKKHADDYTLLASKIVSFPPSWATDFRVYVKETSNEYYNVVMDRVYRAEDGNLWLSFPSSERNKIQEDTFLILKKAADSDALVEDPARYKVVSIKNEVPDYLKTKLKVLIKAAGDDTLAVPIQHLFEDPQTGAVLDTLISVGVRSFKISEQALGDETAVLLQDAGVNVFDFDVAGQYSEKYRIINITLVGGEYTVTLDKNIHSSEQWMFSDTPTNSTYEEKLVLNFYKEITDIKPEFFGKFFVKIEGDGYANQYLNTNVTGETFYGVSGSFNIYYVSDTDAPLVSTGTTDLQIDHFWDEYQSSGGTINQAGTSNESTDGEDDWEEVLDFGFVPGLVDLNGQWFIDEAFYAGIHPSGNHPNVNNPSHVSATNQNYGYGKGIYNDNGQDYIELSFGAIQPHFASGSSGIVGNNQINYSDFNEAYIWEVGSSQNPAHASQNSVTKNLIPGSTFRILGDTILDNIYTISETISIQKIRRYNHTQWGEVQYRFNQWVSAGRPAVGVSERDDYEAAWIRFANPHNRRITYVIPIDKNPNTSTVFASGQTLTDPVKNDSETDVAGNPQTIQFVEQRKDEDADIISSANPVVFETEPKEAIDLNIFYQASDSYPTRLTIDNAAQWVPLGSVVSCKSHPYVVDGFTTTFVTGWEINNYGQLMIKFNQPLDILGLGRLDVFEQQKLVLRFVRPDNSFTSLKGNWVNLVTVPGFASVTPSLKIGNQTAYVETHFANMGWNETAYEVNTQNVAANKIGISWFNTFSFGNGVESDRLRDVFNEKRLSKGVKVSTTIDEPYEEERRSSGLIYSGIYNSNSGVNNLNQFIQAEKITKDLNPTYGSIQKLFSRETDLISFCEDRVIRIAANKDAIFNADGNPQLIASSNVLGQTMPFSGDYGISKNPESFAAESYRAYFTDAKHGAVLRLSKDGLTAISDYGMKDYFITLLKENSEAFFIGTFDDKKDLYNLSINRDNCYLNQVSYGDTKSTVSYSEKNKGWESFKTFEPEEGVSMSGEYYTYKHGYIYNHHDELVPRNTFYGQNLLAKSSVTFLFNASPNTIKSFNTLNYEGTQARRVEETAHPVVQSNSNRGFYNLTGEHGWFCTDIKTNKQDGDVKEFIEKEGKWFNYIKGKKL
jgi:hypothetical protein